MSSYHSNTSFLHRSLINNKILSNNKKFYGINILGDAGKDLLIYSIPPRGPVITGMKPLYSMGDILNLTCASGDAFPAPNITWMIDGRKMVIRS